MVRCGVCFGVFDAVEALEDPAQPILPASVVEALPDPLETTGKTSEETTAMTSRNSCFNKACTRLLKAAGRPILSWRPENSRSHGAGGRSYANTTQSNYCCLNGSGHRSFLVGCRLRRPFHKDGRQDCRTNGHGKVRRGDPAERMLPSPEKCAPTLTLPEKDGLYKLKVALGTP